LPHCEWSLPPWFIGRFKKALNPEKEIKNAPRRSSRYKVEGRIPCKRLEILQISLGIMLSPHSTNTLPSFIMIANAVPKRPHIYFYFAGVGVYFAFLAVLRAFKRRFKVL
tara:strand:+ start:1395 stop:1724 length:330 start_codon:yes stop_codon:yes gene_type:complete